jgi:hypothetical protein
MTRPATTLEQVMDVRARLARGETNGSVAKATGLSGSIVTKIKDGWKPTGKKPVRLTPSVDSKAPVGWTKVEIKPRDR